MKYILTLTLCILSVGITWSQVWDGGGDMTSWDDPLNWDNDLVPVANDVVVLDNAGMYLPSGVITSTGPITANPSRITVEANLDLVLDTDITIGDGTFTDHGLKLQGNVTFTVGSGVTLTFNQPNNRESILNDSGGGSDLFISNGATINISGSRDGIVNASGSTITNSGTINITTVNQDGIDNDGSISNNGTITIDNASSNGINNRSTSGVINNNNTITIDNSSGVTQDGLLNDGTFNNNTTGTLTTNKANEDGIQVSTGATLTNSGTINVLAEDSPGSNNYALEISGTFTNSTSGIINGDGGSGMLSNSRAIGILSGGSLDNSGQVTVENGNDARIIFVDGTLTNNKGGVVDLVDRRMRLDDGTIVNNGLMLSTFGSAAVFIAGAGTATNNAFFDFGIGQGWSNPGIDFGINLANPVDLNIDLAGGCVVDLANVACPWSFNGVTEMTDGDGMLDLTGQNLPSNATTFTNSDYPAYGDIMVDVTNICGLALPIELTSFEAKEVNGNVQLKWSTTTEINNDYFIIERSGPSMKWESIGTVTGNGNSNSLIEYSYLDIKPLANANFYRLQQVDLDGAVTFSDLVRIKLDAKRPIDVKVYPSHISNGDFLTIKTGNYPTQDAVVLAVDMLGRTSTLGNITTGTTSTIQVDGLSKGMHIVMIVMGDQQHAQQITIK